MVKPKINLAENKTVPEGHKTLIIPCYAEGIPEPVITWGSLDVSIHLKLKIKENDFISIITYYNMQIRNCGMIIIATTTRAQ